MQNKTKVFYWAAFLFITLSLLIGLGVKKGLVVLAGIIFCGLFLKGGLKINDKSRTRRSGEE